MTFAFIVQRRLDLAPSPRDMARVIRRLTLTLSTLIWAALAPTGTAAAQTSTWRGALLAEAPLACQSLPNFEELLGYYYTALRADPGDEINLRALRDFSALAMRHAPANQAAFLFEAHVGHNQGRPASSAVTKSLVDAYLDADERDALISLILAPPAISPRTLAEIKFMTLIALTERGEAWVGYELARRNPDLFDDIDQEFAFYSGGVRAENSVLTDRYRDSLQLIELQAFEAGLARDYDTYYTYIPLPESRRNKAMAAFAYGLTFGELSPDFDLLVAPMTDLFDPALLGNVFARRGYGSWSVDILAAANRSPQFGGQVYADIPLSEELMRLGMNDLMLRILNEQYLDTAPALAVTLMRTGRYAMARDVITGLTNQEIAAINPLLVLAIIANRDTDEFQATWANTTMRARLFENLGLFAPAFTSQTADFNRFLQDVATSDSLDQAEIDFNLNIMTNMLELEGRYNRAAQTVARISAPAMRLRSANSLAQAISHRCFGGFQTVSPFYPFTLGDLRLDADYRQRTLRVF